MQLEGNEKDSVSSKDEMQIVLFLPEIVTRIYTI